MSNIITSPTKSLSIALSTQKIPVYITKQEYDQMIQVQQEQINKAKTPRQKQIAIKNKLFLMCLFQTGGKDFRDITTNTKQNKQTGKNNNSTLFKKKAQERQRKTSKR